MKNSSTNKEQIRTGDPSTNILRAFSKSKFVIFPFKNWILIYNHIWTASEWTVRPVCSELFAKCPRRHFLATDFWGN
jgi:hypothetical protein